MTISTTVGQRRLREVLRPRMKASDLARELGVTQQAINAWLAGESKPTPEHMAEIEKLTGIPMRAWVESDDLPDPQPVDVLPPSDPHRS